VLIKSLLHFLDISTKDYNINDFINNNYNSLFCFSEGNKSPTLKHVTALNFYITMFQITYMESHRWWCRCWKSVEEACFHVPTI